MPRRALVLRQTGRAPGRPAYQNLVNAAAGVANSLGSAYAGYNMRKRARSESTPSAITTQHDRSNRYSRRRMPRRRRRRWVRFVRQVQAVELSRQPLQFYDFQRSVNGSTVADAQGQTSFMLNGTTVTNNDELWRCFLDAYNLALAADAKNYVLYMKSACLDLQIANTGTNSVILDVYKIVNRKPYSVAVDPASQYATALGELATTTGGGTVTTTKPSLTPFDAPNFCAYWKVMNKTEYILSAGQCMTLQMRIAKNKKLDGKILTTNPQGIPGYTRAFFLQWRGVPINNAGTAQLGATAITVSAQWSLKYAIPPGKTQEAGRA